MKKGIFITLEGGDGAGKSTHLQNLANKFEEIGREVLIVREPGGTVIGEKIRDLLLDKSHTEMTPRAELLLYEAARAQIVEEKIKPALNAEKVVLCDRFFDSSVAYQGYARGLDVTEIKKANLFATGGLQPDRTIIIYTDSVANSMQRATKNQDADRIELEGQSFQEKVWDGFLQLSKEESERIKLIHLQPTKEETFKLVWNSIKDLL